MMTAKTGKNIYAVTLNVLLSGCGSGTFGGGCGGEGRRRKEIKEERQARELSCGGEREMGLEEFYQGGWREWKVEERDRETEIILEGEAEIESAWQGVFFKRECKGVVTGSREGGR